ncbi:thioesterase family protein [Alteromonadaceae bacterium M269]|nr:thioesterase family protein [Alteromonadaceae bacterium M269]
MDAKQLSDYVTYVFNEQLPFNRFLGFEASWVAEDKVELRLPWKDELMGNPHQRILHGGVTAAILDTIGGLVSILQAVKELAPMEPDEFAGRLAKMGTIDMRVDYLRPGRGKLFIATAEVLRKGNKVAVCRMELHNQDNEHIALGTGTYLVG